MFFVLCLDNIQCKPCPSAPSVGRVHALALVAYLDELSVKCHGQACVWATTSI